MLSDPEQQYVDLQNAEQQNTSSSRRINPVDPEGVMLWGYQADSDRQAEEHQTNPDDSEGVMLRAYQIDSNRQAEEHQTNPDDPEGTMLRGNPTASNETDNWSFITGIKVASRFIAEKRKPRDYFDRSLIINQLISKGIRGNSEDLHRLIRLLMGMDDQDNALRLCHYSLECYPECTDLLADCILISIERGYADDVNDIIDYLEKKVGFKNWNPYVFDAIFRWYRDKIHSSPKNADGLLKSAYEIARERQEQFKFEEKGFLWEAELLLSECRNDEAEEKLRSWILESNDPENDYKSMRICPQCCIMLLEQLKRKNDYDMMIKIALRGLENNHDADSIRYFISMKEYAEQFTRSIKQNNFEIVIDYLKKNKMEENLG
ncbi:MAG: hypothetical protein K6E50_01240 [Lachnospiraceae bacterium]|nr:hypothetical protein [Lachnospiraceae bacterium]